MNTRQRFLETLQFGCPDRIPLVEWPIRQSTLEAWQDQGLITTPEAYFSLDPYFLGVPINVSFCPRFEPVIIEETEHYKIWIDDEGATRKDFKDDKTPGFVTRSCLRFPVENRADFIKMKKRYNPLTDERYPCNWPNIAAALRESAASTRLTIPFLFWTVRQWMGFEGACMCFYDDPVLMHEMMDYITEFVIQTLEQGFWEANVDVVILSEDMAYKGASMISPEMFREFMLNNYKKLVSYLKGKGVKVVLVDSDGDPSVLIPLWIEAGVDGLSPVEIAAGTDPVKIRKEYGKEFCLLGGIDKRVLATTKQAIFDEVMSKVPYLLETGGYIPHTDHAVPPDIPLTNFVYYRDLIRRLAEGEKALPPRD